MKKHPTIAPRALQLSEDLRQALKLLTREMRRDTALLESEIPLAQYMIMATLQEHPGIGVAELARREKVRGPTMSAHIKAMEASGLVTRDAGDPDDRRRSGLHLSALGEQKITAVRDQRRDWMAQRIARLSPASLDALAAAIGPLMELAQ